MVQCGEEGGPSCPVWTRLVQLPSVHHHLQSLLTAANDRAAFLASLFDLSVSLAPKEDGAPHFSTDFRRLSSATGPDSFPFPQTEACIDTICAAVYVTKLDLLGGTGKGP